MKFLVILIFINFFSPLNILFASAEIMPLELFEKVRNEAKVLYKGIDGGEDCLWEYIQYDDEDEAHVYSEKYKFGETTFYSLGCIYGMYNYWTVWLKEGTDGSLIPLTFAYPFYIMSSDPNKTPDISGWLEGQEDPSELLGMSTTRLVCNPTVDEEKMTITTKCLG